jgi:BlaI family transcriptional regulator, penicillinase repressor
MATTVRISDAEWQVMETLWERSPRTAAEVVEALSAAETWSPRTIKTMLNRLIKKKSIAFEAEGKMYLYRPIVSRESAVRAQSVSFVQRVFRGEIKPMLAYFVESETLSPQDIAELRKILARKGR